MPFAAGMYYFINEEGRREKPAIVLIHGLVSTHQVWPADIRRLSGKRVIAFDLPGHGRSGGNGLQSIWSYADQVMVFLNELGLNQVIFIGYCLGGCVALALALRYPESALAVGLISCGAHITFPHSILTDACDPATVPLAIEALSQLFSGETTRPAIRERIERQMHETRSGVFYGDLLACESFDVVDRVKDIRSPALVMAGKGDRLTPPSYAQYLAGQIGLDEIMRKNGQMSLVPDAGHQILLEQPQWVKDKLVAFLQTADLN